MPKRIEKISRSQNAASRAHHRFEHWHVDNQVYFITARCRDKFAAFATEAAKSIFWGRFDHYTAEFGFVPWVTSLLDNHYHTLGYLRIGKNLSTMMQTPAWFNGKACKRLASHAIASILARCQGPRVL